MDASPGSKEGDRKTVQPFTATEVNKSPSEVIYPLNVMRNVFQLLPTSAKNLSEFLHDLTE